MDYCVWQPDNDRLWLTTCRQEFMFINHMGPSDYPFEYCPFCGKKLIEISSEEDCKRIDAENNNGS